MPRPLLYTIGAFFGTGFAPIAPATVASALFAVMWWAAWTYLGPITPLINLVLLVVVTVIGIPVAQKLEDIHGEDPSLVVIDEVQRRPDLFPVISFALKMRSTGDDEAPVTHSGIR